MFFTKKIKEQLMSEIAEKLAKILPTREEIAEIAKDQARVVLDLDYQKQKIANLMEIPPVIADYRLHGFSDKKFKDKFRGEIEKIYEHRCAICNKKQKKLSIDHFYFPKKDGGMFVMRHRCGAYYANAVPMCESCNLEKGVKSHAKFITNPTIAEKIAIRNKKVTQIVRQFLKDRG